MVRQLTSGGSTTSRSGVMASRYLAIDVSVASRLGSADEVLCSFRTDHALCYFFSKIEGFCLLRMAAEGNGAVEQDASRGHGAKKRTDGKLRSGRGRTAKKMAAEKEP